jgi:hypothetical protein
MTSRLHGKEFLPLDDLIRMACAMLKSCPRFCDVEDVEIKPVDPKCGWGWRVTAVWMPHRVEEPVWDTLAAERLNHLRSRYDILPDAMNVFMPHRTRH